MDSKKTDPAIAQVLDFWYAEDIAAQWFNATPALDARILKDYQTLWRRGLDGELDHWLATAEGCLALAITLDQFPLNMFRKKPQSFAAEDKAVATSLHAIERKFDKRLPPERVMFLYMPLMHSEDPAHQDLSVEKFEALGQEESARFARHHRAIIERFGRFPHRNEILGRDSTSEELAWLQSDEAFKG